MNLQELQTQVAAGRRFRFLFFWSHQNHGRRSVGKQCLSQWFPAAFVIDGTVIRQPSIS